MTKMLPLWPAPAVGLLAWLSPLQAATLITECETRHLFGTGTSPAGALLSAGSVDPLFRGVSTTFPSSPSVFVPTNVPSAWLANGVSTQSQWIAPMLNPADAPAGTYVYQLRFTNPCAGGQVTGRFAAMDRAGLYLNGAATPHVTPSTGWTNWTAFTLNNLPAGASTLEFYVTNAPSAGGPPGPTGLRAELTVVATCCPCLVLNCPPNLFVTNCVAPAPVVYSVTGTNRCDTNLVINCAPPSGSAFPAGSTTVSCLATDALGHRTDCAFTVTVVADTQPPQLVLPRRVIVPCEGPAGATVDFSITAEDACDPSPMVECYPPSGSLFAPGTNYVTCTAVNAAGHRSTAEFPVIVTGGCATSRCLDVSVPPDLVVRCGEPVTFTVSGRDLCIGGPLTPVCEPPSGASFPVGLTRVICTVTSVTHTASAAFLVEVEDTLPPELDCSADLIVAAQSMAGAVVTYSANGRDDCSPPVRFRCAPPSGSEFPVGTTRVLCEGTDARGNTAICGFAVTVTPPSPLRASLLGSNQVELRWTGDALVESTDRLDDAEAPWRELTGAVQADGSVRTLRFTPTDWQRFFRVRPLALLPPPDSDGDGVPDRADRCPGTPLGSVVDSDGCSALDFLGASASVFAPERGLASRVVRLLELDGTFPTVVSQITPHLSPLRDPVALLEERRLTEALLTHSNLVRGLQGALVEFHRRKPARVAELLGRLARLPARHADVQPEDFELDQLDTIEQGLQDCLAGSQRVLTTLSNLVHAAGSTPVRERVRLQSFDLRRGVATLADGRQVLLPHANSVAAPPIHQIAGVFSQGSEVDLTWSRLPDGSLVAQAATPTLSVSPALALQLDPRCLRLRVVPANPSLPDYDLGTRHHLKGYKWGFSESLSHHFLEFGMALAVERINCLKEAPGAYRHWLRLERDGDNDGNFGLMVAEFTETSPPYLLKPPLLPPYHPFPILVREYRAPVLADGTLGPPELLGEETIVVEFKDWGEYADAFYDRTIFEIPDAPNATQHQAARVNDLALRFPLTLKPLSQHTFTAWSYKAIGNGTTYPTLHPIHLNEPFAVHFQDPNHQSFFAYSNDVGRALYGPTLSGLNNGKPYSYRVTLPKIVRDRLHDCTGTDSYYRIPFLGPLPFNYYGSWRVSQGNNGEFTHNGWQKYAWDFPKKSGTSVLAARGGWVVDIRESGSASCWNEAQERCVDCTGDKAGNFVRILHQDGTAGVYVHFRYNGVSVNVGQRVYRGDLLGYVGSTGCSTGPHLHFHVTTDPDTNQTIPARFEAYDSDFDFRSCYLPPSDSEGFSTNEPWYWPY